MNEVAARYPRTIDLGGNSIEFSLMTETDQALTAAFAETLADHDLLFLSRNIREPKVVAAWLKQIEAGEIVSVAARLDGKIVGTTAIVVDRLSFSAHVGDIRVLVGGDAREIGLGRRLIQEAFLVGMDLGLEKLTARMTIDQDGAIKVFEELGFRQEALFTDFVKDGNGKKHDLIIMCQDVERFVAHMQTYGLDQIG
tara:strand:- start:3419 stop:4009 length:591 start_codon:yes stop_codon:yes gene_type:complete